MSQMEHLVSVLANDPSVEYDDEVVSRVLDVVSQLYERELVSAEELGRLIVALSRRNTWRTSLDKETSLRNRILLMLRAGGL